MEAKEVKDAAYRHATKEDGNMGSFLAGVKWAEQQFQAQITEEKVECERLKNQVKLYHELATVGKIGLKIKELRKGRYTLRQVEDATGISNAYLSQLENGKVTNPSLSTVNKLIGFLVDGKAVSRYETTADFFNHQLPSARTA